MLPHQILLLSIYSIAVSSKLILDCRFRIEIAGVRTSPQYSLIPIYLGQDLLAVQHLSELGWQCNLEQSFFLCHCKFCLGNCKPKVDFLENRAERKLKDWELLNVSKGYAVISHVTLTGVLLAREPGARENCRMGIQGCMGEMGNGPSITGRIWESCLFQSGVTFRKYLVKHYD